MVLCYLSNDIFSSQPQVNSLVMQMTQLCTLMVKPGRRQAEAAINGIKNWVHFNLLSLLSSIKNLCALGCNVISIKIRNYSGIVTVTQKSTELTV